MYDLLGQVVNVSEADEGLSMRVKFRGGKVGKRLLSIGKVYDVVELSQEDYRVVNDIGEPSLFPRAEFIVIDHHVPSDWEWEWYGPNRYTAGPRELLAQGFYEDYFDRNPVAIALFKKHFPDPK